MESGAWAFETRGNSQEKEQEELQLDEQCSLSNLEVGESMTEERGARPISLVSGAVDCSPL